VSPHLIPNEIVRALTAAIQHVLEAGEGTGGLPAARDVAQVLGLEGLDRALSVCRPGDPDTEPIERRLRELSARSLSDGSLEPWITADPELGRLAVECGAVIEGEPGVAAEGTLTAAEALGDLPLMDDASRAVAARVRLTPQVSAALRAAIDWLWEGGAEPRRVRLRIEDSALEIVCPRVHVPGIGAAAKVLAAVGGNLGPAATSGRAAGNAAGAGQWLLRLPIAAPRPTFLMVTQDELLVALPWHAVLRVCMTPRAQFDSSIRALGLPVLAPLVPLSSAAAEYPVVLLAHGLKRAYFVADSLIWRLPAEPCAAAPDPRVPALEHAVTTEDGTLYRVADPARLLEPVAPLTVADPARLEEQEPGLPSPQAGAAATPAPAPAAGAMALAKAELAPGALEAVGPDPLSELELGAAVEAVEPEPPPELEPGAAAHAAEPDFLPELDPERVIPLALRALVAEDSISARHALVRMLEEHELEVHAVGSAAELRVALGQGPWALVCVDTELPDARGAELLLEVRQHLDESEPDAAMVALVRDPIDESAALKAGVPDTLRKPWGSGAVRRLLDGLGLGPEHA